MPTSARAIAHTNPGTVELRATQVRDPGPGELLIEALLTVVSPGTELRTLNISGPKVPYVPGYAAVGRVVAAGPGAELPVGSRVFYGGTRHAEGLALMWGSHISHAVRAARECFPLPDELDLRDAGLLKLAAIAHHGLALARPRPAETVAVVGLGPLGQLAARLYTIAGCDVVATDRVAVRVALARAAGVNAIAAAGSLQATFLPHFPEGAHVVVDSTGVAAVLKEALGLLYQPPWNTDAPSQARFVVQGSYPGDITFDYNVPFMSEAQLLFTRDQTAADLHAVRTLLTQGKLRPRDLITQTFRPEDAPAAYAQLQQKDTPLLTVAFAWQ
jgi:2-desacetyl-2-hydroxyethyl bacteriochlorophyllide A dehydrogenase